MISLMDRSTFGHWADSKKLPDIGFLKVRKVIQLSNRIMICGMDIFHLPE